ncbi:serine hydrolase [Sphingorhabdus lutea]|uniref:Serine hydrolase n=1 Tax=Sphingorhabdus lutea TaxID=1913578 RepID=A0A1L3JBL2_9SPHN|nr:serine hydrolase domain-containing protein [Sphingorhabdus lutea]APG62516.1 serine hydrolase [Sphingorhabdus lutea]
MKKWIIAILLIIGAAGAYGYASMDKEGRNLLANLPTDRNVLFWTVPQRDAAFRALDKLSILADSRTISAGGAVKKLTKGDPISVNIDMDKYMAEQRNAGLIIIQGDKIRFEKYALDYNASGRWTSFSVAKSFTSTLVGAAIQDGYIKNVDDKVTDYIPDLKGSVYDDVSVEQLLTMTSGVKWNEDYTDPKSDVALFNEHKADKGVDATVSYMRKLSREAPAGSKWVYKTGETNLIGVLVSEATGKNLSQYLSEKIWAPYGMEQDAFWLLGSTGHEISGCCISASLRDYARFGMFIGEGGVVNGKSILPNGWLDKATKKQAEIGTPGRGYGYQWWTNDDGSFAAQGIFGQGIFIDPARKLVIASNGNWPTANNPGTLGKQREAFYKAVQAAIDMEIAAK